MSTALYNFLYIMYRSINFIFSSGNYFLVVNCYGMPIFCDVENLTVSGENLDNYEYFFNLLRFIIYINFNFPGLDWGFSLLILQPGAASQELPILSTVLCPLELILHSDFPPIAFPCWIAWQSLTLIRTGLPISVPWLCISQSPIKRNKIHSNWNR